MVQGFDDKAVIKRTIEKIFEIKLLPIIVCTNSKLLYNCLVKLSNTQAKQCMVYLIYLRQSYERRKIIKIRWIDRDNNLINAMTKAKLFAALQKMIDTNTISLNTIK